jgi:hypothetical protein
MAQPRRQGSFRLDFWFSSGAFAEALTANRSSRPMVDPFFER